MPHSETRTDHSSVLPLVPKTTAYDRLIKLIEKRQAFEQAHFFSPYTTYPTDVNYFDLNGKALLHYAARLGDVDKMQYCLQQGAKIDLLDQFGNDGYGVPAIVLAVRAGHLVAAEYLYSQGAGCHKLYLTDCPNQSIKDWFYVKLQAAFSAAYPFDIFAAEPPQVDNAFFKIDEREKIDSMDENALPNAIYRAIELGNQDFASNYFALYVDFAESQKMQCVLAAVKNNQLALLRYLVEEEHISLRPTQKYRETPLEVAIANHCNEIAGYLIDECGVDPDKPGQHKQTPLMCALRANNVVMTEKLLSLGVNMFDVDSEGKNILHCLANHGNVTLAKQIKQQLDPNEWNDLLKEKNIYGDTPKDSIRKMRSSDAFLAVWGLQQEAITRKKRSNITQARISDKIFFYLQSNYRDKTFFSPKGHCAGLSFLHGLYDKDYYFDTVQQLASWDGSDERLNATFSVQMPQAKYYKNLRALFEQWINDIFWFQSQGSILSIAKINSESQGLHYNLVRHPEQKPYQLLYESDFSKKTLSQIKTMLMLLSLLPNGTCYDFSFARHATSATKSLSGDFAYYDPNAPYKTLDFKNIYNSFINQHCISLNQFDEVLRCSVAVFVFAEQSALRNCLPDKMFIAAGLPDEEKLQPSTISSYPS